MKYNMQCHIINDRKNTNEKAQIMDTKNENKAS